MELETAPTDKMPLAGPEAQSDFLPLFNMRRFQMKSLLWKLCLMGTVSSLVLLGRATPVLAGEGNPAGPEEHLQRMEQRLNDLVARQELMMRRLGVAPGTGEPMGRRLGALPEGQGPMPAAGPENMGPSMPPAGGNPPPVVRIHRLGDLARLIALWCLVCNILAAIWIFSDIRKRGEGPGIFVGLALVAGIPAALIYSLVRIGDKVSATGK